MNADRVRRPAAAALAGAVLAASAGAAAMPAKNLSFEDWDARGLPEGWRVQDSGHHAVGADCEAARAGRCALRIEGLAGAGPGRFLALAQPLGPGPAAGHRLKLTGWVRAEGVEDGWAGLWMRADVESKTVVLENMHREGPRGTAGWKPFEISIDVPANATLVSFGALLSGRGTAWFDDLALSVDTSVKVGRALKAEVIFPPRPVPSNEHVPDASLVLPSSEMPPVRPEWVTEARAMVRPLRSLTSDDFSDLQFLKPLVAGKRVVMLGESGHGVAEFNWMKARLVRFLHREMGFDVLAFESPLSACDLAEAQVGRAAPVDVMRDCLFPVWHSTEVLALFEYLDAARREGRPLALAGFDVQASGRARAQVSARLVKQVGRVDAELAARVRAFEERLTPERARAAGAEMKAAYAVAASRLAENRAALAKLEARAVDVDLAIQELRSRGRYVDVLAGGDSEAALRSRDEGMADNLDFILDRLHPGRKVVVWAHNSHIARQEEGREEPLMMGSWLARRRGEELYALGLFMGWGIAASRDRARYEIRQPPGDSLEAVLASGGWRLAFYDLQAAPRGAGSWAASPVGARTWGVKSYRLVPARAFDGLLYIDAVTPPEYL